MTSIVRNSLVSVVAVCLALCGCASRKTSEAARTVSTPHGCAALNGEVARTAEAKRVALDKEKGAWKAVVPVAVVARYAAAKSAGAKADLRLAELDAELARQGCLDHAD